MPEWKPFSRSELVMVRRSGSILSQAMEAVLEAVRSGVSSSLDLDRIAEEKILSLGGKPSFKGYRGYPASLCISLNDEVVHGIPGKEKRLREGDVVGLDLGVLYQGMYTDMATTVVVGDREEEVRLLTVTTNALDIALRVVRADVRTGDIGAAVQEYVEGQGFGVVRELVGHGVGRAIHEDPPVPNFGQRGTGSLLREGMIIAIEPMVTEGDPSVVTDADQWTVRTRDGSRAAHEERTILITRDGYELLTPKTWDES